MNKPRARRDNPLANWLRAASADQRERAATLAGTTVNYLYQIAGGNREPLVNLAFGIEDATRRVWAESDGSLPIVSAQELALIYATGDL